MVYRKKTTATPEQIEATIGALETIPDKPSPLTRDEILSRLAPSIRRLHAGNHTAREIAQFVNTSQGEKCFIKISAQDVSKIINDKPVIRRGRRKKTEMEGGI